MGVVAASDERADAAAVRGGASGSERRIVCSWMGLLGGEPRKTGWMRAEAAGDPGPWRRRAWTQHPASTIRLGSYWPRDPLSSASIEVVGAHSALAASQAGRRLSSMPASPRQIAVTRGISMVRRISAKTGRCSQWPPTHRSQ
jgi:hypothetical protein